MDIPNPHITHCPICGRIRSELAKPGETSCLPSNCPTWRNVAIYDHEQREWLPVDDDGYVLDGRHSTEVK